MQNTECILVMGVSGVGKTTIGRALADRLGYVFLEADDDHPAANIEKMHAGIALTDMDREPWLDAVGKRVRTHRDAGESVVLACSALKEAYRDKLIRRAGTMTTVYLTAPADVIADRMRKRRNHFMNPALLPSQLQTLEPPEDAITVDASGTPDEVVNTIMERIAPK